MSVVEHCRAALSNRVMSYYELTGSLVTLPLMGVYCRREVRALRLARHLEDLKLHGSK